ncbi:MAG: hypothetical protein A2341_17005 [Deltaproteobacteria bacterium RIFOXYB12_FULL_58_9]|nr:MAG: hypothetical protein A2341_17005 [Deltaproteobacteria bacterium RIFOXYB12_FULL_58_9]
MVKCARSKAQRGEQITKELIRELDRTIVLCNRSENRQPCALWLRRYFLPARAALKEPGTASERLLRACNHLNVFGGMGSWTDVGPKHDDKLFAAYKAALDFAQDV